MVNVILPFLVPMLLGRTIDLRNYQIGGSIYDYANYTETTRNILNSTYHVLQDDSFPYEVFGVPIDIVLRIKSDYLTASSGAMGLGGLLKDTSWKYNSVVVGVVTVYRTVDRKLMDNSPLIDDWKNKIPKTQTHYADTLHYGGWCAVLFKFECDIAGDVQAVRKTLTDTLGVSGVLDNNVLELWNKAAKAIKENEDIRGRVKVKPSVYSTIKLPGVISSPEKFIKFLDDIPNLVTSAGQPMYMSLKPLYDIDNDFSKVEVKFNLTDELEKMDDMFDDLKITKENLVKWTTETSVLFSDDDEQKIYSLLEKINNCIRSFRKVNDGISQFKDIDRSALDLAFHQYLKGLEKGMGSYNLAYMKLREEIDASCENSFLHKIRGLLKVYDEEQIKKGKVEGGLEECEKYCLEDKRCRAVGYADHISELDISTGQYFRNEKQCWIYYRSTNTAVVHTPNGLSGDMGIYDRKCYLK